MALQKAFHFLLKLACRQFGEGWGVCWVWLWPGTFSKHHRPQGAARGYWLHGKGRGPRGRDGEHRPTQNHRGAKRVMLDNKPNLNICLFQDTTAVWTVCATKTLDKSEVSWKTVQLCAFLNSLKDWHIDVKSVYHSFQPPAIWFATDFLLLESWGHWARRLRDSPAPCVVWVVRKLRDFRRKSDHQLIDFGWWIPHPIPVFFLDKTKNKNRPAIGGTTLLRKESANGFRIVGHLEVRSENTPVQLCYAILTLPAWFSSNPHQTPFKAVPLYISKRAWISFFLGLSFSFGIHLLEKNVSKPALFWLLDPVKWWLKVVAPFRFYLRPRSDSDAAQGSCSPWWCSAGNPERWYPYCRYGWKNCKLNQPISHSDVCNYDSDLIFFPFVRLIHHTSSYNAELHTNRSHFFIHWCFSP